MLRIPLSSISKEPCESRTRATAKCLPVSLTGDEGWVHGCLAVITARQPILKSDAGVCLWSDPEERTRDLHLHLLPIAIRMRSQCLRRIAIFLICNCPCAWGSDSTNPDIRLEPGPEQTAEVRDQMMASVWVFISQISFGHRRHSSLPYCSLVESDLRGTYGWVVIFQYGRYGLLLESQPLENQKHRRISPWIITVCKAIKTPTGKCWALYSSPRCKCPGKEACECRDCIE